MGTNSLCVMSSLYIWLIQQKAQPLLLLVAMQQYWRGKRIHGNMCTSHCLAMIALCWNMSQYLDAPELPVMLNPTLIQYLKSVAVNSHLCP
jgi:hypothetical protein